MKSIWTDGLVRWHGPIKSRMKVLWLLWATSFGLLALWLLALVLQEPVRAWSHALLAGALVVMGLCVIYAVKYCEFLEPRFLKWIGGSRLRHSRSSPSAASPKPDQGESSGDSGPQT
jgi:hypothetical protein